MAVRQLPTIHRFQDEQRSNSRASTGERDYCLMSCPTLLAFLDAACMRPHRTAIHTAPPGPFTQFPDQQAPFSVLRSQQKLPVHVDPRTIPSQSFPWCRLLHMYAGCVCCGGSEAVRVTLAMSCRSGWLEDQALIGSSRVLARACSSSSSCLQRNARPACCSSSMLATPGVRDINYKRITQKIKRLWSRSYISIHAFSRAYYHR